MKTHAKHLTTTVIPTTVFDYEPLVFYEFSGECLGCEEEPYIVLNEEITAATLAISTRFNQVSSYLGLFLNLIHLFFLTRKELRGNVVFFIMIGICLCDILTFSACIVGFLTQDDYLRRLPNGRIVQLDGTFYDFECLESHYWKTMLNWYSEGVQKFGRHCAAVLALSMTMIRATSVLFPMSSFAHCLMKLKNAVVTVVASFAILGAWYGHFYLQGKMAEDISNKKCYYISIEGTESRTLHEGFLILVLTILYLIFTVILLVELCRLKQRRRNLRSTEKSDNTFNLIITMTISFFIAELAYSGLFIANNLPYEDGIGSFSVLVIIVSFRPLPYALMSVNSITHCFVCLFMSSQYREVVLGVMRWNKRKATMPNAMDTTRTETDFRRTTGGSSTRKNY